MLGVLQLTPDQQGRIFEARAVAEQQVPAAAQEDDAFLDAQVLPSLPEEARQRMRAQPHR